VWTVLIVIAPLAFAGVTLTVLAIGFVRNALIAWRLRALERFASAQGLSVRRSTGKFPDVAADQTLTWFVTDSSTTHAAEGARGARRFAAFAMVRPVADFAFEWGVLDYTGLAGRAAFVAVAVECRGRAARSAAPLRRRLRSWHVAVGADSVMAWREGTAGEDDLTAALLVLLEETGGDAAV
jgi:hypothetical protein